MKKLTFEKISEIFDANDIYASDLNYFNDGEGGLYELLNGEWKQEPTKEGKELKELLGEIELVSDEIINEDCWKVFLFKEHNVYLRIDGWYASYEGSNYEDNDMYEVRPKDVVVTQYPKITLEEKRELTISEVVD